MSNQSVEGSPSRICARVPLRSLENEKHFLPTPIRRKSRSRLNQDFGICSPPPAQMTQTTEMADCAFSDVTFKSFTFSNGQVIVSEEPSSCPEDSIVLPQSKTFEKEDMDTGEIFSVHEEHPYCIQEQLETPFVGFPSATKSSSAVCDVTFKSFTCTGGQVDISNVTEMEDETVLLPSEQMATGHPEASLLAADIQQCDDHFEHPYCRLEANVDTLAQGEDLFQSFVGAQEPADDSPIQQYNEDLLVDSIQKTQNDNNFISLTPAGKTMCFNSVSNVTKMADETILLPSEQMATNYPEANFLAADLQESGDHFEHPYCRLEPNVETLKQEEVSLQAFASTQGQTEDSQIQEKNEDLLLDSIQISQNNNDLVTLTPASKTMSFNSVSNVTKMAEETVLLHSEQPATDHPEASFLATHLQECSDQFEHSYCRLGSFLCTQEQTDDSQIQQNNEDLLLDSIQRSQNDNDLVTLTPASKTMSFNSVSNVTKMADETVLLPSEQTTTDHPEASFLATHLQECGDQFEHSYCRLGSFVCTQKQTDDSQTQQNNEDLLDSIQRSQNDNDLLTFTPASKTMSFNPGSLEVQHKFNDGSPVLTGILNETVEQIATGQSDPGLLPKEPDALADTQRHLELSEAKDSALGSSDDGPEAPTAAGQSLAETVPNVFKVLSEYPSVVSALHLISPVRRASESLMRACRETVNDCEKNTLSPDNDEQAAWWAEHLESPIPSPLLNSTTLCNKTQSENLQTDLTKKVKGSAPPFTLDYPLQQQLRQMAEFLILASGKMDFATRAAAAAGQAPPPVESRSTCVGVTPVKRFDRSLNTSGEFVRKVEFSVADASTLTDPLLWNCIPSNLDGVPREELEQRLLSSMIVGEALVQQLAAARAPLARHTSTGAPPSQLRDRPVQTDHTELSQTTMYRDLYMEALKRIGNLEQDGRDLQELVQSMQGMRVTMTSLTSDTDAALTDMKKMEAFVREDHQSLASHYDEMKAKCTKLKDTQLRMTQKVKEAFQQRDQMKTEMEDALTSKHAAFATMEQLRTHCADEMAELERSVGSQRQLLAALNITYTEQVALNQTSSETLNSTLNLVSQTVEDQSNLTKELSTVRNLVQRSAPLLAKLNEKAAAALKERDEHISTRDRVLEENELLEEKLKQAQLNHHNAEEQIGDLNQQITILTSEVGVLRQKLMEREDERAQLESTVTQMSATLSSTTASHTMLEHMLAEETCKLEEAQRDANAVKEIAEELASSKRQAEEGADELARRLAERDGDLERLMASHQSQSSQIQELRDVCRELGGVAELNEFLQAENQVTREQLAENENALVVLHERNIQCEDLKAELRQKDQETSYVQEQLQAAQAAATAEKLERGKGLARAVTEITLLHHALRGATDELHLALGGQESENATPSSFEDNGTLVSTAQDRRKEVENSTPDVSVDSPSDAMFSKNSAFTRLPVTPKSKLAEGVSEDREEGRSSLLEPLALLSNTVTELVAALKALQRLKDDRLDELQRTVSSLEMALEAEKSQHTAEAAQLKRQLSLAEGQAARREQALQQQEQNEKTISKLMTEVTEAQETATKHSLACNELRQETSELCRSLQRSETQVQILRVKLIKAAGQTTADDTDETDQKLFLLQEVERLNKSLQETQQTKAKLLERAKRNQAVQQTNLEKCEMELQMLSKMMTKVRETLLSLPDVVNNCEQLKVLSDYLG
ncbi:sperm-associated antigen 5 [Stigmatopora argus]